MGREAPDLEVRYSVERVFQWEKFMRLVGDDERVRRVCIGHRFLNGEVICMRKTFEKTVKILRTEPGPTSTFLPWPA